MRRSYRLLTAIAAAAALAVWRLLSGGGVPHARHSQGYSARQVQEHQALVAEARETVSARVVRIVDGDTLHVQIGANEEKVRLFGINAPELHPRPGQRKDEFQVQPFAQQACDALADFCPVGNELQIQLHGQDKYGRLLGVLLPKDGRDVNRLLVEAGLARAYFLGTSKKDPLRIAYEAAEAAAQNARRGIWKE